MKPVSRSAKKWLLMCISVGLACLVVTLIAQIVAVDPGWGYTLGGVVIASIMLVTVSRSEVRDG
ncbi:hypothetical protein IWX64_003432 [Arthrobacter sp. CAN_A212]